MLVLEDLKRRLGVARKRRVVQYGADLHLAVCAALEFRHFRERVKLAQLTVFSRQQASRQRKTVSAQPSTRCRVYGFEPGLGGL